MTLRPLGDRVLIRPEANPEQTASGLWLSEHRKPEEAGTVVAVGRPVHPQRAATLRLARRLRKRGAQHDAGLVEALVTRKPAVAVGDFVLFSWNVGQDVSVNDERYLLLREDDLLAVVDSEV